MRSRSKAGAFRARVLFGLVGATLLCSPASAGETLTYSYDALGRLVKVSRTGTVNNNDNECYTYDPASNRSNLTVNIGSDCSQQSQQSITVSPTTLPNGKVGVAYGQTITATGGTSPYTFSISAGAMPSGVGLTPGGLISGTPNAQGTFNFTIKATDSASNSGTQAYTLVINSGVIANSWSQTISACGSATVNVVTQVHDSDPDGDPITVSGISNVDAGGTASYSGTAITYSTSFSRGTGSLTYTITDGHGDSASNNMSFTISGGTCAAPVM